jgi:hypothetical protein
MEEENQKQDSSLETGSPSETDSSPETNSLPKEKTKPAERTKAKTGKKGGFFQKIPKDILLSPGGMILMFFALLMEIIDFFIPWPLIEETVMLPLNIIFCVLLAVIAKVSVKSMVIPFLIERVPILSSILPTFLIRLFF